MALRLSFPIHGAEPCFCGPTSSSRHPPPNRLNPRPTMSPNKLSFWEKLDRFPPIVCRLLARRKQASGGIVAMTASEIASRGGMTVCEVNSLSWLTSWEGVPMRQVRQFSLACGVDFCDRANMREHSAYVKRCASFKYLKKSPEWDSVYSHMIRTYVSSVRPSA